jgi:hypothetical protein
MAGKLRSDIIALLASGQSVTSDIAQLRSVLAGRSFRFFRSETSATATVRRHWRQFKTDISLPIQFKMRRLRRRFMSSRYAENGVG